MVACLAALQILSPNHDTSLSSAVDVSFGE